MKPCRNNTAFRRVRQPKPLRRFAVSLAAAAALAFLSSLPASAATTRWSGAGSGNAWATAGNWTNNVPTAALDVTFNASAANSKWSIDTGSGSRPALSLTFLADLSNNQGFTFTSTSSGTRRIDVGSGGIVNNDNDTQTFDSTFTVRATASQTWNAAAGSLYFNSVDLQTYTVTIDGAYNTEIAGVISGNSTTGQIVKRGSGTLTYSGSSGNAALGKTVVENGTLLLSKTAGDAVENGNGVPDLTIGDGAGSAETAITRLTQNDQIDNSASVIIKSDGLLDLNGKNETIGILEMAGGKVTTGGGTLTFGGTSMTNSAGSSSISGALTFTTSSARTVEVASGTTLTISANISNGGITKTGAGTLVLGGSNGMTANTTINAGTVEISSDGNLGASGTDVNFGGGTLAVTDNINPGSGRVFTFNSGGGTLSVSSGKTLTLDDASQIAGANLLTKTGAGTLAISGNNSSFTGGFAINGGTVQIGAENNLGAAGNDVSFDGGSLKVTSGFTANSGKVFTMNSGGGTFDIDSSQTLTLGTAGQLAGTGNLTKSGSGTLILSGDNSSTFTSGNTISINGGTVEISNENNLGGGGNDLAFNGGTLKVSSGFTANSGKTLTFNGSGGTLDVTSGTLSFNSGSQLYGSGDLTKSGAGDLIISADNPSYSGNLKLNSGELQVAGTGAQLSSFLNNTRMANLSGTGPATFMVNQTDSGTATLGTGPVLPSQIKLGFEGSGTFALGTTANDMSNFEGLIIEGGTVSVRANQRFTGDATGGGTSAGTSLYISGGELELFHADSKTLEFTGNITLAGGVIDGGLSGGAKGKLRTESDLIVNSVTTLQSKPDLEFLDNATDAHTISLNGASSTGWGTITLAGQNQLTVNATGGAEVGANRIDVSTGTLLWGADNVITGTTEIKLGYGGTLKTSGFDDVVGPLTLDSTIGYIDLDGGDSTLEFADTAGQLWSGGGQLVIKNWDGLVDGNGNDKVIFGDVPYTGDGLTDEQLAQIWFENPAGFPPGMYPAEFVPNRPGYSHYGQIRPRPVPEPATVAMVVLLIGVVAYRERNSLGRWKTALLARLSSPRPEA